MTLPLFGAAALAVAVRHWMPPFPFAIECRPWRKERISDVRNYNIGLFSVVCYTRATDVYSQTHTQLTLARPDIWIDEDPE